MFSRKSYFQRYSLQVMKVPILLPEKMMSSCNKYEAGALLEGSYIKNITSGVVKRVPCTRGTHLNHQLDLGSAWCYQAMVKTDILMFSFDDIYSHFFLFIF